MSKQLNIFECEKNMLDQIFQKQYPYADESKRMPMFIREQDKTITIRKHLEDEILLNKQQDGDIINSRNVSQQVYNL